MYRKRAACAIHRRCATFKGVDDPGIPSPFLEPGTLVSESAETQSALHRTVARGTLLLVGAQFLTTPLSIVLNMIQTRRLGAEDFGTLFLAGNLTGLAFLFVDWGQSQSIATATAREPGAAARYLGTGLFLKVAASLLACGVLWILARLLHYSPMVQVALLLSSLQSGLGALAANYSAVLRGRERMDKVSQLGVIGALLNFALVVPVLLAGGGLVEMLVVQSCGTGLVLLLHVRRVRAVGVGLALPDRQTAMELLRAGSGFFLLAVVLALQPALDSVILSKFAPAEVVGWHSAARRFIGFLIFPATTLYYAVYPTLARLVRSDFEAFLQLTRSAMRAVVIFGVPAGVGCALYAPQVIRLFSGPSFSPAAPVLQVLSLFVFLVYFSIIFGSAFTALELQMKWALIQLACVLVSAIGDPLLVPWCQERFGNGAIGISFTSALSELLMVAGGIWLAPRGLIDRPVLLATGRCLLAGGAMAAVGRLAAPLYWPLTLALSLGAYAAALSLSGGLGKSQIDLIVEVVRGRARRFTMADEEETP